ncbi:MAG: acetyl-CoA acetyltransferase [Acidimicrobiia bacterium]
MPVDPRTPVLVGVGVAHQKSDDPTAGLEAIGLMGLAAERAAEDAGPGAALLAAANEVIVPSGSWQYRDPARLLVEGFGASGAQSVLAQFGILQLSPFTRACDAILAGSRDVVLIAGGEARFRALRGTITGQGEPDTTQDESVTPDETLVPAHEIITRQEIEAKLISAPLQYSIIEGAWRTAHGQSVDENVRDTAELWARFAAIAAANPDAWRRDGFDADFLANVSEKNPPLAAPYRKWNVSQWNVDQASAFIVCASEVADRMGVPDDRRVYPHAIVEGNHMVPLSHRAELHRSEQVRLNGERLRELTGINPGDADFVDLYSCFPIAVKVQAAELGIDRGRDLTVTGGMTFGGGPVNNYTFQAVAKLAERLREQPGSVGVNTAISGMITKHAVAMWSTTPPADGFRHGDVTEEAAARTATVEPLEAHSGPATVEGYTVSYEKGAAVYAAALARTDAGDRCVVRTDDTELAAAMAADEWNGRTVTCTGSQFHA